MEQNFSKEQIEAANAYMSDHGFMVMSGLDIAPLLAFKEQLLTELKTEFGESITLESYHEFVTTDEAHKALQFRLFSKLAESQCHAELVRKNQSLFKSLFGPDIDIQVQPYLRVARPHCLNDNIGLHRDTFYGNSAYEVSNSMNLTRVRAKGALNLVSGSHKLGRIDTHQEQSQTVTKGSDANKMGFLYAPKVIQDAEDFQLTPVTLAQDEILIFSLGVIHGQIENQDNITRWSIDFRLKPTFAPVSQNLKACYYRNLFRSGLSQAAAFYYEKMPDEQRELTHTPE